MWVRTLTADGFHNHQRAEQAAAETSQQAPAADVTPLISCTSRWDAVGSLAKVEYLRVKHQNCLSFSKTWHLKLIFSQLLNMLAFTEVNKYCMHSGFLKELHFNWKRSCLAWTQATIKVHLLQVAFWACFLLQLTQVFLTVHCWTVFFYACHHIKYAYLKYINMYCYGNTSFSLTLLLMVLRSF